MSNAPVRPVKTPKPLTELAPDEFTGGFDVVVEEVIGRVDFSDKGVTSPVLAAMNVIAQHVYRTSLSLEGARVKPARYSFPDEDGDHQIVVSIGRVSTDRRQ